MLRRAVVDMADAPDRRPAPGRGNKAVQRRSGDHRGRRSHVRRSPAVGCTPRSKDVERSCSTRMLSSVQLDPTGRREGAAAAAAGPAVRRSTATGSSCGSRRTGRSRSGPPARPRAIGCRSSPMPGLDVLGNDALRLAVTSFPLVTAKRRPSGQRALCDFARHGLDRHRATRRPAHGRPCLSSPAPLGWPSTGRPWRRSRSNDSRMLLATAVAGGRAYEIRLEGAAERSLFLAILASMELDPGRRLTATPRP